MEQFLSELLIIFRVMPYLLIVVVAYRSKQMRLALAAALGIVLAWLGYTHVVSEEVLNVLRGLFVLILLWHAVEAASFIRQRGGK